MTFIIAKKNASIPEFSAIGDRAHPRCYSVGKPDKLAKFPTDVLPYEATWLQAVQQFRAADNRGILEAIVWRELRQTRATQSPHALI